MKKNYLKKAAAICLAVLLLPNANAYAQVGDMGIFTGTSEGSLLPSTISETIALAANKKPAPYVATNMKYKEIIFITGIPTEVECTLTIKNSGAVTDAAESGTYTSTHTIAPIATAKTAKLNRTIVFNVDWKRNADNNQILYSYSIKSWKETVNLGGEIYTLDSRQSRLDQSKVEYYAPGVVYTTGNTSQTLYYTSTRGEENQIIVDIAGDIYGYSSAHAATESQRLDVTVDNQISGWQMQIQIRPTLTVSKTLIYNENEPTAISYDGQFVESTTRQAGIEYDISVMPQMFKDIVPSSGSASIKPYNSLEPLVAVDMGVLKGNEAEADIKKLFSMQILTGSVVDFVPSQSMTRAQFVTALTKLLKLPVQADMAVTKTTGKKNTQPEVEKLFQDVDSTRTDYKYLKAAADGAVILGVGNAKFRPNDAITRQEAYTMLIRCLRLESLGQNIGLTKYADDEEIANWATQSIYAASQIGLIAPDDVGNIYPTRELSKSEAAATLNIFIDYLRNGLPKDYTTQIVNFTR